MRIHTCVVSDFSQNARVISNPKIKETWIIDPGAEVETLVKAIPKGYTLTQVILTHCHIDHCGGVAALFRLCEKHKIPRPTLSYHSEGSILAQNIDMVADMYNIPSGQYENSPKFDSDLAPLKEIMFGDITLRLLNTPGHAPGHVSLFIDAPDITLTGAFSTAVNNRPVLIAGDALFKGSIGRTDLPGGDHELLLERIRTQLFTLPDSTLVLTGHGDNTTIGTEKQTNPYFH